MPICCAYHIDPTLTWSDALAFPQILEFPLLLDFPTCSEQPGQPLQPDRIFGTCANIYSMIIVTARFMTRIQQTNNK